MKTLPSKLPFYINIHSKPDNGGFPQIFPFTLFYNKKFGLFQQKETLQLHKILHDIYQKGSLLGGMNDQGNKLQSYAAYSFVTKNTKITNKTKLLEIGCGSGHLLAKFLPLTNNLYGIEPGPHFLEGSTKKITIIRDFFPSNKLTVRFSIICHFNVLEHISDPIKFLSEQRMLLEENGSIICGFPNCEPYLANGDISMFTHEHFNYFTRASLQKVAQAAGLYLKNIEVGAEGGMLFAELTANKTESTFRFTLFSQTMFLKRITVCNEVIRRYLKGMHEKDIAIYCPTRAMNILYLLKIKSCRLVDDDQELHKKYLPWLSNKIENFEDLKNNPPKKLLIYSRTFGEKIKQKCIAIPELKNTDMKTIEELYQTNELIG